MASAIVKLYNVEFNSEMNCVVDDIATYLNRLTPIYSHNYLQYQKIELDMELKLPLEQTQVASPTFNYVSLKNKDTSRTFYFFVRDVQ